MRYLLLIPLLLLNGCFFSERKTTETSQEQTSFTVTGQVNGQPVHLQGTSETSGEKETTAPPLAPPALTGGIEGIANFLPSPYRELALLLLGLLGVGKVRNDGKKQLKQTAAGVQGFLDDQTIPRSTKDTLLATLSKTMDTSTKQAIKAVKP